MSEETKQTQNPKLRPKRRRLLAGIFVVLFVLIVLLPVGVLSWFGGDAGRSFIEKKAKELTASSDTARVDLQGLNGTAPWDFGFARLTLSDAEGVWLIAENGRFDMKPWALAALRIHVREASVQKVELLRTPQAEDQAPAEPEVDQGGPIIPELPKFIVEDASVGRLSIAEGVTGKALTLSIAAEAENDDEQTQLFMSINDADGGDAAVGEEGLVVDLLRRGGRLFVDLEIREPGGGFPAALAGLPPKARFDASVKGEGPLQGWQGRLEARSSGIVEKEEMQLSADLGIEVVEETFPAGAGLQLDGVFKSKGLLPEGPARDIVGEAVDIELDAIVHSESEVQLEKLLLAGKEIDLSASGAVNTAESTFDVLAEAIPKAFEKYLPEGVKVVGLSPLRVEASGAFDAPDAKLRLAADRIEAGGAELENILLTAAAKPGDAMTAGVDLGIKRAALPDSGMPAGPASLKIRVKSLADRIEVTTLHADALGLGLNGTAEAKFNAPSAEVFNGAGINGTAVSFDSIIRINENMKLLPPEARRILGPSFPLQVRAHLGKDILLLRSLMLDAPGADLNLAGRYLPDEEYFAASGALAVPELAVLAANATQEGPAGSLNVQFNAEGVPDAFSAGVNATSPQIVVNGERLRNVGAQVTAENLPADMRGAVDISLGFRDQRLEASSGLGMDNGTITAEDFLLTAGKARISSDELQFDTASALAEGRFLADIPRLSVIEALGGPAAQGALKLDLEAAAQDGEQFLEVDAAGAGLRFDEYSAKEVKLDGRLRLAGNLPSGTLRLDLRDGQAGDIRLDTAGVDFRGTPDAARTAVSVQGSAFGPFTLDSDLAYRLGDNATRIALASLEGRFSDIPLRLKEPTGVVLMDKGFQNDALHLSLGNGTLHVEAGGMQPEAVDLDARIESLPLDTLQTFVQEAVTGLLDAKLSVKGDPARPQFDLSTLVEGFSLQEGPAAKAPKLRVELKAQNEGDMLSGNAEILGLGPDALLAEVRMPLQASLDPVSFAIPENAEIDGKLTGKIDLAPLPDIFDLGDTLLEGDLDVHVAASGAVDSPRLEGSLDIARGRYENLGAGVLFQDIQADADLDGERIELKSLSAGDGVGGALQGTGSYFFAEGGDAAYMLEISLNRTRLVHLPSVKAAASGNLALEGDSQGAALLANLTTDGVNIEIPETPPPSVTELEYEHVNATKKHIPQAERREVSAYPIELEVRVDMPNRVFVRGRGMDIELAGNLAANGTASQPSVFGTLNVVRGRINFAGRTFIVSEGEVFLDGSSPPSPRLNVTARGKAGDIIAIVSVRGPAKNLRLSLSSEPALPEDEVISHILFGRSASDLNPVQALILADTYRTITGGGGPGVMGQARNLLGLDQLNVGTDNETGGVDVGVGKYLREDVYIEFDQNVETGARGAKVEVEITPEISVESTTNTQGGGGVGINWKNNF